MTELSNICGQNELIVVDSNGDVFNRNKHRQKTARILNHRVWILELVKRHHRANEIDHELRQKIEQAKTDLQLRRQPLKYVVWDVKHGRNRIEDRAQNRLDDVAEH